jgi:hypothetical protein
MAWPRTNWNAMGWITMKEPTQYIFLTYFSGAEREESRCAA